MPEKKLYYKIGEACKLLDIQPYVLRYWETEFPALSPSKSKSGQRVYGETDFSVIQRIKELLYEEGYTIAGAKKKLETELASGGPKTAAAPADILGEGGDAVAVHIFAGKAMYGDPRPQADLGGDPEIER